VFNEELLRIGMRKCYHYFYSALKCPSQCNKTRKKKNNEEYMMEREEIQQKKSKTEH
jgi:hypothetical protein